MSVSPRTLLFHPALSYEELAAQLPNPSSFGENQNLVIEEKLAKYSIGLSRKNVDVKSLVGYTPWNLIELRWEIGTGQRQMPIRLIGSEISQRKTLFLLWHVKNTHADPITQRKLQNIACETAIERMQSIEISQD